MSTNARFVGLPWFVAQSLQAHLIHLGGSLYTKTDLLALLYGSTNAIVRADKKKLSEEDTTSLQEVKNSLNRLLESYEPILDDPENASLTIKKRVEYNVLLSESLEKLMYIIHKYEVVDASLIGETQAKTWDRMI